VEILFPKGPLGAAPRAERRRFLRDQEHVPGVGLSIAAGEETRLRREDVRASDWFPGTIAAVYAIRTELAAEEIAVKEPPARRPAAHPPRVLAEPEGAAGGRWRASLADRPDEARAIDVEARGDEVVARDAPVTRRA